MDINSTDQLKIVCAITNQIMIDPVITADGHTYEREAIETWLQNHSTSPKTGLSLPHKTLIPNLDKKSLIMDYLAINPGLYDTDEIYLPNSWIGANGCLSGAIKNDDLDRVKGMLQDRRLLMLPLDRGYTAYHLACQYGSQQMTETLLKIIMDRRKIFEILAMSDSGLPAGFRPMNLDKLVEKALIGQDQDLFLILVQLGADIIQQSGITQKTLMHRMLELESSTLMTSFSWLLKEMSSQHISVDIPNSTGSSPLLIAVINQNIEAISLLLCAGANPSMSNAAQQSPLSEAILRPNEVVAKQLLTAKLSTVDLSTFAEVNHTLTAESVNASNVTAALLELPPLHISLALRDLKLMEEILVEINRRINSATSAQLHPRHKDRHGRRACRLTRSECDGERVIFDSAGRSPKAAREWSTSTIGIRGTGGVGGFHTEYMDGLEHFSFLKTEHEACNEGDIGGCSASLSGRGDTENAHIEARDPIHGWTPLLAAVAANNCDAVALLLQWGCNTIAVGQLIHKQPLVISQEAARSQLPSDTAVTESLRPCLVQELSSGMGSSGVAHTHDVHSHHIDSDNTASTRSVIACGPDISITPTLAKFAAATIATTAISHSATPDCASYSATADCATADCATADCATADRAQTSIFATNSCGSSNEADPVANDRGLAVHLACYIGCEIPLLQALVTAGTVTAQSECGDTCLHIASARGHAAIVSYLLTDCIAIGLDPNIRNNNGWTAFDMARAKGHYQIAAQIDGFTAALTRVRQDETRRLNEELSALCVRAIEQENRIEHLEAYVRELSESHSQLQRAQASTVNMLADIHSVWPAVQQLLCAESSRHLNFSPKLQTEASVQQSTASTSTASSSWGESSAASIEYGTYSDRPSAGPRSAVCTSTNPRTTFNFSSAQSSTTRGEGHLDAKMVSGRSYEDDNQGNKHDGCYRGGQSAGGPFAAPPLAHINATKATYLPTPATTLCEAAFCQATSFLYVGESPSSAGITSLLETPAPPQSLRPSQPLRPSPSLPPSPSKSLRPSPSLPPSPSKSLRPSPSLPPSPSQSLRPSPSLPPSSARWDGNMQLLKQWRNDWRRTQLQCTEFPQGNTTGDQDMSCAEAHGGSTAGLTEPASTCCHKFDCEYESEGINSADLSRFERRQISSPPTGFQQPRSCAPYRNPQCESAAPSWPGSNQPSSNPLSNFDPRLRSSSISEAGHPRECDGMQAVDRSYPQQSECDGMQAVDRSYPQQSECDGMQAVDRSYPQQSAYHHIHTDSSSPRAPSLQRVQRIHRLDEYLPPTAATSAADNSSHMFYNPASRGYHWVTMGSEFNAGAGSSLQSRAETWGVDATEGRFRGGGGRAEALGDRGGVPESLEGSGGQSYARNSTGNAYLDALPEQLALLMAPPHRRIFNHR